MAAIQKKPLGQNAKSHKKRKRNKAKLKPGRGFEKGWEFWKTAQLDLSNFTFDREEANAR